MNQGISRRQFLRGGIAHYPPEFPPPWFQNDQHFHAFCDQCGDCLTVCQAAILERGDGGYPRVNFQTGECSFCAACVLACPTGALAQQPGARPWALQASINTESCLASRGILCQVCGDHCGTRAIHFPRSTFSIAAPILNLGACNGCGACIAPCPMQALTMVRETG